MGMAFYNRKFSYAEWLELVAKTPKISYASSREKGNESWNGSPSFDAAMNLANNGWPEGLAKVKDMAEDIWKVIGQEVQKMAFYYDVTGEAVDIDRFLTGEPEDMIAFTEEQAVGHGKIVKIQVNNVASAGVSTTTMANRGAAVVALIDALEKLGFSCEVYTADALSSRWSGDKNILQYDVTLRGAGDVLDMDRLAFALCHPSWLRRLVFSAMEQEDEQVRRMFNVGGSYGCPEESRGLTSEENGVDVPSLRLGAHNFQTQEAAQKWVLAAAAKVLGRPVEQVA